MWGIKDHPHNTATIAAATINVNVLNDANFVRLKKKCLQKTGFESQKVIHKNDNQITWNRITSVFDRCLARPEINKNLLFRLVIKMYTRCTMFYK